MIQISALEYCFLTFPQFRKDFGILKEAKVLIHLDDEHCEWKLSIHCLMDYFLEMDPDHSIYNFLIWELLKPVETLFGLEKGIFDKIEHENMPDPSPDDYKNLETILYKGRYAEFEMPKELIDFSYYRDRITNPCKFSGKRKKPVFADYVLSFVSCLKQFDTVWGISIEKTEAGYFEGCFGNIPANVYREKETELTDMFIRRIEDLFPNYKADFQWDKETYPSKLKEEEENRFAHIKNLEPKAKYIKNLNVKEAAAYLHITPAYLYNLVHYRKITAYKPGGKMLLFKIEDLEKYVLRNRKGAGGDLSEQADAILQGGQSRRRKKK